METKYLTEFYHLPEFKSLEGYKKNGGYVQLPKALKMKPQEIIDEVKASGLRGRGGAGFSTGMKWGFLPKNNEPRFLLCNADEGEPGTFKDRMMMEKAPHQLIEGMVISGFAISSAKSYIYIRGEYRDSINILETAIQEAYKAGFLGKNILGSGFDHDMDIYRGAGAYICGEETGMISSLEGLKGQPKLKPPFPAVQGYLKKPTIVNNVETLAAVKYVIPGGSSAPVLTADESMKALLDYETLAQMGTMLGSGAIIVIDDSNCAVECLANLMHFYHHESCGQCTPCREGTGWLDKITKSILSGRGRMQDIELLLKVADNMKGKTICALSDAAALPVLSFVPKFRDEFEYFVREGKSKVKGTSYRIPSYYSEAAH